MRVGVTEVFVCLLNVSRIRMGMFRTISGHQGIEKFASEKVFGVGKRKRDISSIHGSR